MRPRDTLAANLKALMQQHANLNTLPKLIQRTGMTNGTLDRIRRAAVSVGVDELEKLAQAFELQPWQLLVEGLDPGNPPVLAQQSVSERELYARLRSAAEAVAQLNKPNS
jgi:transcriptional regulator with XRE-family HTH domain